GVYAAMLSACATKAYHQALETAVNILLNRHVNDVENAVEEPKHLRLLFEEIFHYFVSSMECLVFGNSSRVENTSAIENESATVGCFINWTSLAIREAADLYYERSLTRCLSWCELLYNFIRHTDVEHLPKFWNCNSKALLFEEFFQIAKTQRYCRKELCFSFEQATKSIGAEYLQESYQYITIILTAEDNFVERSSRHFFK